MTACAASGESERDGIHAPRGEFFKKSFIDLT